MTFPQELRYSKDHEWLRLEGTTATIGITEFAQHELGDIVFVDIATVGQALSAHTIFGSVEAVKTVSDLFMPVGGRVLEVNPKLENEPELVNTDPYGDGWMVKLELTNAEADLVALMDAGAYQQLVGA